MPLPTEPRSGGHRRKVAGPPGYFCRPFDAALDEGLTQIPDIGRRGLRERRDEPGVRRLHGHSSRIVVTGPFNSAGGVYGESRCEVVRAVVRASGGETGGTGDGERAG